MISAVIYSLSVLVMLFVVASYWIAFKMKPSLSILALALFFTVVFIINVTIAYQLWCFQLGLETHTTGTILRSFLLLSSSIFLLYTTWKKN